MKLTQICTSGKTRDMQMIQVHNKQMWQSDFYKRDMSWPPETHWIQLEQHRLLAEKLLLLLWLQYCYNLMGRILEEVHNQCLVDNLVAVVDNLVAGVDNLVAGVDNLVAGVDNLVAVVDNLVVFEQD